MTQLVSRIKILLVILVAIGFTTALATKVLAATDQQFITDYAVSYVVDTTGVTQITQSINITNLRNDVIATSFVHTLNDITIYEVTATLNGKQIESKVSSKGGETQISVSLDGALIGEGRQNKIVLMYKTTDIAGKIGSIWNVYIPKTQMGDSTTSYSVSLSVPQEAGSKLYMSPVPITSDNSNGLQTYNFTKDSLTDTGITASFGSYQMLNFRLRYQLQNPSIFPSTTEIALPPDIKGIQQVSYTSIEPKPTSMHIDQDGNTIAIYRIGAKQKLEIQVVGEARITGKQINPDFGGGFDNLPSDLVRKYTAIQPYWEVNSTQIQGLARSLKDGSKTVAQNAQYVYKYITQSLAYNFDAAQQETVQRNGALAALTEKGPWTCMEFTDLFVATARAMGIPARAIDGYAFTDDQQTKPVPVNLKSGDLLHAWPEFYDPFYGWVQVDPTWGATSGIDYFTKLDTNHFALVVQGLSSEQPQPAGMYRFNDSDKLVEVDLAQNQDLSAFADKLTLKKVFNFNIIALIEGKDRFAVTNTGQTIVYGLNGNGSMLAPGATTHVYLPRGSTKVTYEDFNGNEVHRTL